MKQYTRTIGLVLVLVVFLSPILVSWAAVSNHFREYWSDLGSYVREIHDATTGFTRYQAANSQIGGEAVEIQ